MFFCSPLWFNIGISYFHMEHSNNWQLRLYVYKRGWLDIGFRLQRHCCELWGRFDFEGWNFSEPLMLSGGYYKFIYLFFWKRVAIISWYLILYFLHIIYYRFFMFWCEIGIKWILNLLNFAYTLGLKAYSIRAGRSWICEVCWPDFRFWRLDWFWQSFWEISQALI